MEIKVLFYTGEENTPKQGIQVLVFTKTGIELSKLIEPKVNSNYIEKICASFINPKVKIEYGDLLNINGGIMFVEQNRI